MVQVAVSTDFLKAFADIPRQQQKKVRAFVEKFKADPTQKSINYEPIHDMVDDKVRTVRIDQAYRAVVLHPPQGDVYLCVWVDHHDDAMDWARKKHFEVNPNTGSLQVWQAEDVQGRSAEQHILEQPVQAPVEAGRLFSAWDDEDLLLVGVPPALLAAVRALRVEPDLDGLSNFLPEEARDGLYMLAAGYSLEDTVEALVPQKAADATVDVEDFSEALIRPGTARQFKLIESDAELAEMLDAPLEQWRVFLHPSQRSIVTMKSQGAARVLGGAGTGKTVVAMHRARHLAKALPPDSTDRVLFTTFTTNLAADIRRSLDVLCGEERQHIEVSNLHAWAAQYLKGHGVHVHLIDNKQASALWDTALTSVETTKWSAEFVQDEWETVVLPQDITTEQDYLRARRVGRGTGLKRADRKEVWRIMQAYRAELDDAGQMEYADLIREARLQLEKEGAPRYRHLVVDEVQDLTVSDLRLLRALVSEAPNDIFVVGDAHQRIYQRRGSLGQAGISVRGRRSRYLRLNYRTTESIRNWATALLEGIDIDDLDDGRDDGRGYRSLRTGPAPEIERLNSPEEEAAALVEWVARLLQAGVPSHAIAVVGRTKRLLEASEHALKEAGHPVQHVTTKADLASEPGIRLATMHRVKGLEFPCVAIVGVNKQDMPLRLRRAFPDEAARVSHVENERRLLYVAATRARDHMRVSCGGKVSEFLG